MLGFLPGLIPCLLLLTYGFVFAGIRELEHMRGEDFVFLFMMVIIPFVYGTLVTWLSLYLRWGSSLAVSVFTIHGAKVFIPDDLAGEIESK